MSSTGGHLTDLSCPVLPFPVKKLRPQSPCGVLAPVPSEARLALASLAGKAVIVHTPECARLLGRPSDLPGPRLGREDEAGAQLFGLAKQVTLALDTDQEKNLTLGEDLYLELGN